MKEHIDTNNLIPEEQKGCASNSLGCIDQLLSRQTQSARDHKFHSGYAHSSMVHR